MKTALTIAGSDSSGGAGIQADIKAMTMNGAYAMSAVTALTAQNTTGVRGIYDVPADFLGLQLDAVFDDIFPDAVKIGMVSSKELICVIADRLRVYGAKQIVLDPVMVAASGARLLKEDAVEALKEELIPLAELITPNIPEAEILSGIRITDERGMEKACRLLYRETGCAVLLKGGHRVCDASDLLICGEAGPLWFGGMRIDNPNTHGTGCTLSSAIAANLAKGERLPLAVQHAKDYLTKALAYQLDLGNGSGPLAHNYLLMEDQKDGKVRETEV